MGEEKQFQYAVNQDSANSWLHWNAAKSLKENQSRNSSMYSLQVVHQVEFVAEKMRHKINQTILKEFKNLFREITGHDNKDSGTKRSCCDGIFNVTCHLLWHDIFMYYYM